MGVLFGVLFILAIIAAFSIAFAKACQYIAGLKGYDRRTWFWLGMFLWLIALVIINMAPRKKN